MRAGNQGFSSSFTLSGGFSSGFTSGGDSGFDGTLTLSGSYDPGFAFGPPPGGSNSSGDSSGGYQPTPADIAALRADAQGIQDNSLSFFSNVMAGVGLAKLAVRATSRGISSLGDLFTSGAEQATARTFSSTDPLVGDLANKTESMYPGHVQGVNVPLYDAPGKLVGDADILLKNAVIQVKSGPTASGILGQLQVSEQVSGLPALGFGPNFTPVVMRTLTSQGALVTTDKSLLLQVVKP